MMQQEITKAKVLTIIKPLEDRVLIRPELALAETQSGIIIPDSAQEVPRRGTVMLKGDGVPGKTSVVEQGDVVMYGQYTGTVVESKGEKLLMMRESDIICIIAMSTPDHPDRRESGTGC